MTQPRPLTFLRHRLLAVVAVAAVALAAADAIAVLDARRHAMQTAASDVANLSQLLAEQASGVFQAMDTILVDLRERVETDGTGPVARARLDRLLALRVHELTLLHRIMVVDAQGRVVIASGAGAILNANIADRPVFLHHRSDPDRALFLGPPVRDPIDHSWIITVTRRLDAPDGSFAGVVGASVPTSFFQQAYGRLDIGERGVVLFVLDSGRALARWPADPHGEGQDHTRTDLFTRVLGLGRNHGFVVRSGIDGLSRLGSYHRLNRLPALVLVGRSRVDVLAGWYGMALAHLFGVVAVLATIGLLGLGLARKIAEEARDRAALADANIRLATSEALTGQANRWLALAEQVAQLGHWVLEMDDPPRLTWSDEVYRIHGQDPRRFEPSVERVLPHYHRRDQHLVAEAVADAFIAGAPFEFVARLMLPDGSTRHVLNRGLPQVDAQGSVLAVFGVVLDVTEQRAAEAALQEAHARVASANLALEAANQALEAMALQDSLMALANRRQFDRALEGEFRRAMRSLRPLALIMIDVDRFKQFNDLYGHQAGDSCLRAIAAIIPPLLERPGETAARYGGEELAILLPGSTEEGARLIATRITEAVRSLAILHDGSQHGVVTVSAGVAAVMPPTDRSDAASLVGEADRALYAAKRAGRNGVRAFSDLSPVTLGAVG